MFLELKHQENASQKEHGWSLAALRQGARDLELSPAAVGILDRPEAELVEVTSYGVLLALRR